MTSPIAAALSSSCIKKRTKQDLVTKLPIQGGEARDDIFLPKPQIMARERRMNAPFAFLNVAVAPALSVGRQFPVLWESSSVNSPRPHAEWTPFSSSSVRNMNDGYDDSDIGKRRRRTSRFCSAKYNFTAKNYMRMTKSSAKEAPFEISCIT